MKSMLVTALILLILAVVAYKTVMRTGHDAARQTPPSQRFLDRCTAAAADEPKPEAYCRCLWEKGIRTMSSLAMSASAKDRAAQCAAMK